MTNNLIDECLKVYSGQCPMCNVGNPTDLKDANNQPLFTGDIVALISQDIHYRNVCGITVIVSNQFQAYSDGTGDLTPFVMGIRSVDVGNDPHWEVHLVKSHKDVIEGEHWKAYGFHYKLEPRQ